jgi:hypothetical protein
VKDSLQQEACQKCTQNQLLLPVKDGMHCPQQPDVHIIAGEVHSLVRMVAYEFCCFGGCDCLRMFALRKPLLEARVE